MESPICEKCGKNTAAQGDTKCYNCGGFYHCTDSTCNAPECKAKRRKTNPHTP